MAPGRRGTSEPSQHGRSATGIALLLTIVVLIPDAGAQTAVSLMTPREVWAFDNGAEFPGARGGLTVEARAGRDGGPCLKLVGDFNKGGNYVQAGRPIDKVDIDELSLWVKNPDGDRFSLRLGDASGQTHQIVMKTDRTADWQRVVLPLQRFFALRGRSDAVTAVAKYESWGGAGDGQWHGPATAIYLLLGNPGDNKVHTLWLDEVAIAPRRQVAKPAPFQADFEANMPGGTWAVQGGMTIDKKVAFKGSCSLLLARSPQSINRPWSVTSPAFAIAPGIWEVSLATKSDLQSPDSSYSGVVSLECSGAKGQVIERFTIADVFGKRDWAPIARRIELPPGASSGRFHVQLNKADGRFWVDELKAAYASPAPSSAGPVARMLFSSQRLGNLFYPGDPVCLDVSVETVKPLPTSDRRFTYEVRDYWGAEQMSAAGADLQGPAHKDARFVYHASIDLSKVPLEVGRYYELHATTPQNGAVPFRNYTSMAILPEAVTKRYQPEEVPFTSRSWDNRLPDYLLLSDRLGLRTCGIWGGWSATSPYAPEAPSIEVCQKLGMGVITGTPAHSIEQGEKTYSEQALREGARRFVEKYGKIRPLIVSLGNEPHGTGERVRANVEAYRIVYQAIKQADPTIIVVATSVEPNEEYFRAGYGKWCDAYDFHVYESHNDVRKAIEAYRGLMKKYEVVKPIWSTELGLNSQGLPRHDVAVELVKKFSTFFAAGGTSASWFGILYPDPEAKIFGSSGDAHNVFDCRYSRYSPRLDAIAYYNMVNAIAIKKFVSERQYSDGIRGFLFADRDNRHLQVLWKDKGRQDVFVPLPGAKEVRLIEIDGLQVILDAASEGLTVTVSEEPILLLYDGGASSLALELGKPAASLLAAPSAVSRRDGARLVFDKVSTENLLEVKTGSPLTVTASLMSGADHSSVPLHITITPPASSSVRASGVSIMLKDAQGKLRGRLRFQAPITD